MPQAFDITRDVQYTDIPQVDAAGKLQRYAAQIFEAERQDGIKTDIKMT